MPLLYFLSLNNLIEIILLFNAYACKKFIIKVKNNNASYIAATIAKKKFIASFF